MKPHFAVMRNV